MANERLPVPTRFLRTGPALATAFFFPAADDPPGTSRDRWGLLQLLLWFLDAPSGSGVGEREDRPPPQPLFLKFLLLLAPPVHFAPLSVGTCRIFSFGVVGATEPSFPC